jgi:ribose transport system permease protein
MESLALPAIWIVMIIVFAIAEPGSFISSENAANVFGSNAALLMVAIAALLPFVVGDFDFSVGAVSGLSAMVIADLNVNHHVGIVLACVIGVAIGLGTGGINAVAILTFETDPFIITLATGTIATGVVYAISGSDTIAGTSLGLTQIVFNDELLGIPLEFYFALAIVAIAWYWMRLTPSGQRALFVGQSREVARLTGIRVKRVRAWTFLASGLIAGLSGVIAVGAASSADPTSGPALLLPAFAAAFLGMTTIEPGRFNAVGTTIAVFFLATGVDGLQLLGVQDWVQDVFYGAVLVIAVTASRLLQRQRLSR